MENIGGKGGVSPWMRLDPNRRLILEIGYGAGACAFGGSS
jgi:hypothetical protein